MFNNVLFLQKMGMDFSSADVPESDVFNYRVRTFGECIPMKDFNGLLYFFEFGTYKKHFYRTVSKRGNRTLKHPVKELVNGNAMSIDTEFTKDNGSWRNASFEAELYSRNYSYTKEDILKLINSVSTNHYDRIIFAYPEAINIIWKIRTVAGYREREILNNLSEVKRKQWDKNYHVFEYVAADGNSFEYECLSGKITG